MLKYICIFLITAAGLSACSTNKDKPEDLIAEDKYVELLIEMQLVRSYAENADTDSTIVDSLTAEVYKKYNITDEQFLQSHNYYQQFPEEQRQRVDQAIEKLNMELVTEPDSAARSDTLRSSR